MRTHRLRKGIPTATYDELNYEEQAKSISGSIKSLEGMINSNIRRAREENRDFEDILERRLDQVQRMVNRLRG